MKKKAESWKEGNVSFDLKSNAETFKNFYANRAMDLVRQLSLPTSIFGTNSVKEYYRHLNLEKKIIYFYANNWRNSFKITTKYRSI